MQERGEAISDPLTPDDAAAAQPLDPTTGDDTGLSGIAEALLSKGEPTADEWRLLLRIYELSAAADDAG